MGDGPKDDPDRMSSEDIDLTDPDAIDAWLDEPVAQALADDLGRVFQFEPLEERRRLLQESLRMFEDQRRLASGALERETSAQVRAAFETLRDSADDHIARTREKLRNLSGP